MYTTILALHSLTRWFVLAALLFSLYRAYSGWLGKKAFTPLDDKVRHRTATIAHIQLVLGLVLYFVSPLISYFLHNYHEAVHDREIRFFGMEHSLMMFLAIIILTIGSMLAKRKTTDAAKFKTIAIWYTVALLIILSSIPFPFSPMVSRPWLRL